MKFHAGLSWIVFIFSTWDVKDICNGNQVFKDVNVETFKFSQIVDKDNIAQNLKPNRKYSYKLVNGQQVAVYDNLIPKDTSSYLYSYVTQDPDSWIFNAYDNDDTNSQVTNDSVAWVTFKDPLSFANSTLGQILATAIRDMSGKDGQLFPYKVMGKVIRRGDFTKVVADSYDEGDYSALVYINTLWKRNWYGETLFYNNNKDIVCGVTPKTGRVVTWDASALRLMRPPAMSVNIGQVLFHVIYSTSKEKMLRYHEAYVDSRDKRTNASKNWYLPGYIPKDPSTFIPDPAKHLTAEFKDKGGRRIFVFDGLFPDDILYSLREHVLMYGRYHYSDDGIDAYGDNVQWIASYSVEQYLQSPFWNITKEALKFATGKKTMFPYDVTINLIRNADHTKIHEDCDKEEREWTFLVYLNPDWTQDYYGETVYFEKMKTLSDVVAEVRPKFGRAALFEGSIPHSARPPSPYFKGARLSFAVKSSVNEKTARHKCFMQEMNHFTNEIEEYKGMAGEEQQDSKQSEDAASFYNQVEKLDKAEDILSLHSKMKKKYIALRKENAKLILHRI